MWCCFRTCAGEVFVVLLAISIESYRAGARKENGILKEAGLVASIASYYHIML